MDATWDDPTGEDHEDHHEYRTDYLFIPPQVAGFDHFPDEPRWQLRDVLLTRAAFLRQPMTGPGLAREQLALQAPAGPVVDVDDKFTLKLENPRRVFVSVGIGDQTCGPSDAEVVELECDVPAGAKEANVFSNRAQYGTYDFVAGFKLR
jgi:transglutaminase/protease-like cytokinesis protein 3